MHKVTDGAARFSADLIRNGALMASSTACLSLQPCYFEMFRSTDMMYLSKVCVSSIVIVCGEIIASLFEEVSFPLANPFTRCHFSILRCGAKFRSRRSSFYSNVTSIAVPHILDGVASIPQRLAHRLHIALLAFTPCCPSHYRHLRTSSLANMSRSNRKSDLGCPSRCSQR